MGQRIALFFVLPLQLSNMLPLNHLYIDNLFEQHKELPDWHVNILMTLRIGAFPTYMPTLSPAAEFNIKEATVDVEDDQPITKEDSVGGNTKGSKPAATRPAAKVWFTVDVEALRTRTQAAKQNQQAPIKIMSGHAWSPGIYQALRLLGKTLDVAWERTFIHSLTSN
jgi:hypothetical protein